MPDSPAKAASTAISWECVDAFIGKFTHDIRNGLNAFELQLTYLGEICDSPEELAETKRLRSSLAGVTKHLQAVRLAASEPSLNPMDYPAADFLEDLRERFDKIEGVGAAKVQWSAQVGNAKAAIDPELTMGAILEILKNGLEFGGDAPEITLSASASADLTIEVDEKKTANTLSIDTSDWGRTPLHSSRRGAYGLGLFRARRILEAQGGSLSARFDEAERCLITSVVLPLARP